MRRKICRGLLVTHFYPSFEKTFPRSVFSIAGLALVGLFTAAAPQQAHAISDGCTAINRGDVNITATNGRGNQRNLTRAFEPGDVIMVTLDGTIVDSLATVSGTKLLFGATSGSASFTITGSGVILVQSDIDTTGGTGSITWQCSGAAPVMDQQANAENSAFQIGNTVLQFNDPTQLPGTGSFVPTRTVSAREQELLDLIEDLTQDTARLQKRIEGNKLLDDAITVRLSQIDKRINAGVSEAEQVELSREVLDLRAQSKDYQGRISRDEITLLSHEKLLERHQSTLQFIKSRNPAQNYASSYAPNHNKRVGDTFNNVNIHAFGNGLRGEAFSNPTDTDIPFIAFARGGVTFLTGSSDGQIGTGQAGISAQLTRDLVVGAFLLGTIGNTESTSAGQTSDTDTAGLGGGLYSRFNFLGMAGVSLSGSYIITDNDVKITGAGAGVTTGSYRGSTLHMTASVDNTYDIQGFAVTPSLGATFLVNQSFSYVDSNGSIVSSTNREEISADFGLRVARAFQVSAGFVSVVNPWVSGDARAFISDSGDTFSAGQKIFAQETANFSLGSGLNIGFVNGGSLDLDVHFNNLTSDSESINVGGRLNIPLAFLSR